MTNNEHANPRRPMSAFFGATGDLALRQIFPALYAMVKRGALNVPVIGVADSKWEASSSDERVDRPARWAGP